MFVEDLPMWGYIGDTADEDIIVGEIEGSQTYLFTHLHFLLGQNRNQLVSAKVSTDVSSVKLVWERFHLWPCSKNNFYFFLQMDRRVDITDTKEDRHIQFSYSVEWFDEPNLKWKDRMTRYAESRFLPSSFEIHWLSIINSFVLVLLLTSFLTIILLRVLKNDFSKYIELDDDVIEEEEVSLP